MRKLLVGILAVGVVGGAVARGQSQGDILRHIADCHDDFTASDDYSAYLRCMADVQDEIDRYRVGIHAAEPDSGSSTGFVPSPRDVGAYNDLINCIASAKASPEIDKCSATYKAATDPSTTRPAIGGEGRVPDIPDKGTPHGEFVRCMYFAQKPDEVLKCSAAYKAAQSAPSPPVSAGLPIGPNSYTECSQRDPSITEQECNTRLSPHAPILSACKSLATEALGFTQPEEYRLCAVKVPKK